MRKRSHPENLGKQSAELNVMDLDRADQDFQGMMWRVERLERQIGKLSELIREHAVDADRLVQIVAEDRDILRQELTARLSGTGKPKKSTQAHSTSLELLSS